jgi:hypothetical protein
MVPREDPLLEAASESTERPKSSNNSATMRVSLFAMGGVLQPFRNCLRYKEV